MHEQSTAGLRRPTPAHSALSTPPTGPTFPAQSLTLRLVIISPAVARPYPKHQAILRAPMPVAQMNPTGTIGLQFFGERSRLVG